MAVNNAINKIITPTPTALAVPTWDSNANMSANSIITSMATTVRASFTNYTLTVASNEIQQFTGASQANDPVVMPVTSTLTLGKKYTIINSSSGAMTVCTSAGLGTPITSLPAGATVTITCILTSGTTAASWYFPPIFVAGSSGTCGVTAVSCQTPGDLSIGSLSTGGNYRTYRTGPTGIGGIVTFNMSFSFTPTYTTASGQIQFTTNLPFPGTSTGSGTSNAFCISEVSGATWTAGQIPSIALGTSLVMYGRLNTSASSVAGWPIANFPSGTAVSFVICGSYPSL